MGSKGGHLTESQRSAQSQHRNGADGGDEGLHGGLGVHGHTPVSSWASEREAKGGSGRRRPST
ncbi:hypothetical protein MBELCI_0151 [Limimaricola cinnabarinus LL-001]|uniref:Uncharacterized protein n=1 Tax=Limimaricola cinnabarinus LL-001 TaxID=1337093 RepID=U3A8U7_9RHOB|nr:hypothetical protein MBELCI_0151 [Limimaricola cinnabarinus LL-001]